MKRGPAKGYWRVDECSSSSWSAAAPTKRESSVSGSLWAELDITAQTGRKNAAPDRFRRLFLEVEEYVKKTSAVASRRTSFVGPKAARLYKEGLVLGTAHRGGTVNVYK